MTTTTKKFGKENVRASLCGPLDHAPQSVVGLPLSRLMTNNYCKEGGKKEASIIDEVINSGPPISNVSEPKVVTTL